MLSVEDIDSDLEDEVRGECEKYGKVEEISVQTFKAKVINVMSEIFIKKMYVNSRFFLFWYNV